MANIIRVKIDIKKVLTQHLFHGKNGAEYLDCALIPVRESKYGETHFVIQDLPRELRDAGKKGPILGNATEKPSAGYQPDAPSSVDQTRRHTSPARPQPTERQMANQSDDESLDIPF